MADKVTLNRLVERLTAIGTDEALWAAERCQKYWHGMDAPMGFVPYENYSFARRDAEKIIAAAERTTDGDAS